LAEKSRKHSTEDQLTRKLSAALLLSVCLAAVLGAVQRIGAQTVARARELLALRKLTAQQQRISDLLSIETERKEGGPLRWLVVRESGRTFFVAVDDIEWIEAIGDYAGLHVKGRTHMLRE